MLKRARYRVVRETPEAILIRDLGPWDRHPTVTNDAEQVVAELVAADRLRGRRLFCRDSEGTIDELRVAGERFAGFAPGPGPFDPERDGA